MKDTAEVFIEDVDVYVFTQSQGEDVRELVAEALETADTYNPAGYVVRLLVESFSDEVSTSETGVSVDTRSYDPNRTVTLRLQDEFVEFDSISRFERGRVYDIEEFIEEFA